MRGDVRNCLWSGVIGTGLGLWLMLANTPESWARAIGALALAFGLLALCWCVVLVILRELYAPKK